MLAFVAGGFGVALTPWYAHRAVPEDGLVSGLLKFRNVNADILFVGDSSLGYGVIPRVVADETGLNAFSISLHGSAFDIGNERVLDQYLAQNKRPRLIVVYISPWADPEHPTPELFDAVSLLWRNERSHALTWQFLLHNPEVLYQYPFAVWYQVLRNGLSSQREFRGRLTTMNDQAGFIPYWLPSDTFHHAVLADGCSFPVRSVQPASVYFDQFRNTYGREGTQIIVYVAPLPDCDQSVSLVTSAYADIAADQPYQLPHKLFISDVQETHLAPEGASVNSRIVADTVASYAKAWLHGDRSGRLANGAVTN